jgi:hypothetical protein
MASAIRSGRAELLGSNLGDPVYFGGAFWQVSADNTSYELVVNPIQAAVCASALRRLRIARATP